MAALEAAGICIFCAEHVAEHQARPVEHSGEHWYVPATPIPTRAPSRTT